MIKKHYKLLAHQFRLYAYNAKLEMRSLLYCGQQDALQEQTEAWLENFLDHHPCLRPQLDWRYDFGDFGDKLADKWEAFCMTQEVIYPHPTRTRLPRLSKLAI